MKTLIKFSFILLLLSQGTAFSQAKTVNGVYAGIELTLSTVMGGGMNRNDVVILFRSNGTFNDDLSKADWQSRVSGRYTVNGSKVSLRFNNSKGVTEYTIDKDGDLNAGSFNLVTQPTDSSIPPGNYEFSSASGSGGGSSGMTYVGTSSNKGLYFDGKGNFASSSHSATAISGANVGGGSSHKGSGRGTYSLSKGLLKLIYDNGATEMHSFFCRPGYKPIMAVIDGNIYFVKDRNANSSSASTQGKATDMSAAKSSHSNSESSESKEPLAAKSILLKANMVHGGQALDKVKTLSFVASIQGLQANGYVDLDGQRVRLEVRQGGKLAQVEQVEGHSGWQWRGGKVSALPGTRLTEMSGTLYSGLLGLRRAAINSMSIKSIKQTDAGYAIIAQQDGQQHAFIINGQSRLVASADQSGQTSTSSTYSDFRTVGGVLIPFGEVNTSGSQRLSIQYQKFTVNPALSEQTWSKP